MTHKPKPKGIRHPIQRRGRKPKDGMLRYPGGKIRNPTPKPDDGEPNARLIAVRAHMLGLTNPKPNELAAAENPLDLALARGWIAPNEHQAGVLFAGSYLMAGVPLPRLRTQDLAREIRGGARSAEDEPTKAETRATESLRDCAAALNYWPKCTAALLDVCVLGDWPAWMIARINGAKFSDHDTAMVNLRVGLRIVAKVFGCGVVVAEERRIAG